MSEKKFVLYILLINLFSLLLLCMATSLSDVSILSSAVTTVIDALLRSIQSLPLL